ncbi:MAG: MFS transporter [Acidimicrobiales bacterium]
MALDSTDGRLVVGTTVAGSAVAMLTATVVNVALPALADDLGATSGQQQWVVNGYLLTIASLILIGGNLGDRYGRLRLYRIGTIWFAAASLLCAAAPSVEVLIAARLLQGIGGALLTPGSLAIIEATLRPDDRGRGVGQWSGLSGVAGAVGPLVGGLLVDISWRWVFLLNLPVAAVVLVLSRRVPESIDRTARDQPLDIVGAGLAALFLGGASFAMIQGPTGGFGTLDWIAVTAAVGSSVILVVHERRQSHPMVPVDLFTIRPFVAANVVTLLVYGGMGVVFFLLSIQLQVALGWSPIAAGAALLPVTALMMILSSRFGDLAQRIGPRWPLTFGPVLIAGGMLLLAGVGPGDTYATSVLPGVLVFGLGLAASVAPVTATALGSIPDERAGAASGLNNAISRSGQLLTIAAVPPLVGLTGDALGDAGELAAGFQNAMFVGAGFVVSGAVAAALLFHSDDLDAEAGTGDDGATDVHDCGVRYHCGVESPQLVRH